MRWTQLKIGKQYEFRPAFLNSFPWTPFTLLEKNYAGRTYSRLKVRYEDGREVWMMDAMYHIEKGHIREVGS